jgi:uncharacterized protein
MIIGLMVIDLFSDHFHSLKDKRRTIASIKDRVRKFNVAVAESDFQDLWQKAQLSLVSLSSSKVVLENLFRRIEEIVASDYEVRIVGLGIDYF